MITTGPPMTDCLRPAYAIDPREGSWLASFPAKNDFDHLPGMYYRFFYPSLKIVADYLWKRSMINGLELDR